MVQNSGAANFVSLQILGRGEVCWIAETIVFWSKFGRGEDWFGETIVGDWGRREKLKNDCHDGDRFTYDIYT